MIVHTMKHISAAFILFSLKVAGVWWSHTQAPLQAGGMEGGAGGAGLALCSLFLLLSCSSVRLWILMLVDDPSLFMFPLGPWTIIQNDCSSDTLGDAVVSLCAHKCGRRVSGWVVLVVLNNMWTILIILLYLYNDFPYFLIAFNASHWWQPALK